MGQRNGEQTLGRIWLILFILVAAVGIGTTSPAMLAQATPNAGEAPVDDGDPEPRKYPLVLLPETATDGILTYMYRIEFDPGDAPLSKDMHNGMFDLTVASGSICYEVGELEPGTTVTAFLIDPTASHPECNVTPNFTCEPQPYDGVPSDCELFAGTTIFLSEGSSIRQMGDGEHLYSNVHTSSPATVYLTGYQQDSPSAGCRGGCM